METESIFEKEKDIYAAARRNSTAAEPMSEKTLPGNKQAINQNLIDTARAMENRPAIRTGLTRTVTYPPNRLL